MIKTHTFLLTGVTVLTIGYAVWFLSNREANAHNAHEGFRIVGTTMTGDPKPHVSPNDLNRIPSSMPPLDALSLSMRNKAITQTNMACMEQISNHRTSDEFACTDNGTAKPFEMSADMLHSCTHTRVPLRKHSHAFPANSTNGGRGLRVGAFAYQG